MPTAATLLGASAVRASARQVACVVGQGPVTQLLSVAPGATNTGPPAALISAAKSLSATGAVERAQHVAITMGKWKAICPIFHYVYTFKNVS